MWRQQKDTSGPVSGPAGTFKQGLLLDSRVVDVPLVYNLAFAMLSALKLLFFKSLKNALRVSENTEA